MQSRLCLIVGVLCTLSFARAQADTIITNLSTSSDNGVTFVGDNGSGFDIRPAAGFALAAGSSFSLDNIVVRLSALDSGDDPLIRLFSDSSGPDSALATFADPSPLSGTNNYTLAPTSSVTLSSSTTYWIVMQNLNASSGARFDWQRENVASYTGTASYAGNSLGINADPSSISSTTRNFIFEVNGTALTNPVPEPSTVLLIGLGIAGFALLRRRKG